MVTILLVIRSVTDVLAHWGLTPYTFYKPTLGPQYVSNRPYNEFITPTTFIWSIIGIFNGLLSLDSKYAVT